VTFRAIDGTSGDRCAAPLKLFDAADKVVFEGTTKDERFDANDHLSAVLRDGEKYRLEIRDGDMVVTETIQAKKQNEPITLRFD